MCGRRPEMPARAPSGTLRSHQTGGDVLGAGVQRGQRGERFVPGGEDDGRAQGYGQGRAAGGLAARHGDREGAHADLVLLVDGGRADAPLRGRCPTGQRVPGLTGLTGLNGAGGGVPSAAGPPSGRGRAGRGKESGKEKGAPERRGEGAETSVPPGPWEPGGTVADGRNGLPRARVREAAPRCGRSAPSWSAQRLTTNAWPFFASAEQELFSAAVILRVLTVTALLLPSVPLGAGPVTVSGTNQK